MLSQIFLLYSFVGIDLGERAVVRMRKKINVLTCLNIHFDHLVFFLPLLKGFDQLANIVEYVTDFIFNSDIFCFLVNHRLHTVLVTLIIHDKCKKRCTKPLCSVKLLANPGVILISEPIIFLTSFSMY